MDVQNELLGIDIIMADILVRCDDEATRKGLTRGFYVNLVNQALEKLAMSSYFNEEPPLDVPMPTNFRWKLPENFFNIQQLYAFNGDCCDVATSANIYYKRNFNNAPNGNGYTAMNKGSDQSLPDPYFWGSEELGGSWSGDLNNALFANVQNGWLMFSSACSAWSKFRIIYNGLGGAIGQSPLVPRALRQVVTDLVVLNASEVLMVKFPKSQYGALYQRTYDKLYNKQTGTYWDAQIFVRQSDGWVKECRSIYFGNYYGE